MYIAWGSKQISRTSGNLFVPSLMIRALGIITVTAHDKAIAHRRCKTTRSTSARDCKYTVVDKYSHRSLSQYIDTTHAIMWSKIMYRVSRYFNSLWRISTLLFYRLLLLEINCLWFNNGYHSKTINLIFGYVVNIICFVKILNSGIKDKWVILFARHSFMSCHRIIYRHYLMIIAKTIDKSTPLSKDHPLYYIALNYIFCSKS